MNRLSPSATSEHDCCAWTCVSMCSVQPSASNGRASSPNLTAARALARDARHESGKAEPMHRAAADRPSAASARAVAPMAPSLPHVVPAAHGRGSEGPSQPQLALSALSGCDDEAATIEIHAYDSEDDFERVPQPAHMHARAGAHRHATARPTASTRPSACDVAAGIEAHASRGGALYNGWTTMGGDESWMQSAHPPVRAEPQAIAAMAPAAIASQAQRLPNGPQRAPAVVAMAQSEYAPAPPISRAAVERIEQVGAGRPMRNPKWQRIYSTERPSCHTAFRAGVARNGACTGWTQRRPMRRCGIHHATFVRANESSGCGRTAALHSAAPLASTDGPIDSHPRL